MDLRSYLDQQGFRYQLAPRPDPADPCYIKSVVIKADGQFVLCALPASDEVDLDRLRLELHTDDLRLADDAELREHFPDLDLSCQPPIGWIHGMPTLIDESLFDDPHVFFHCGHDSKTISMSFLEFHRLTHPAVAHVGHH